MNLFNALKEKIPALQWYAHEDAILSREPYTYAVDEIWVYLPHEDYPRGRLAFHDTRVDQSRSTEKKYAVYTGHIQNNKFHSSRRQYNMQASKNLDTALRAAKRYLLPITPRMVADNALSNVLYRRNQTAENTHTQPATTKYYELTRRDRRLVAAMTNLRKAGVDLLDAELNEMVDEYVLLKDKAEEYRQRKFFGRFIYASQTPDGQTRYNLFTVGELGMDMHIYSAANAMTVEVKTEDEVDEDTVGRVSVLSMAQEGEYIADVGVKLNPKMYFVEFDYDEVE